MVNERLAELFQLLVNAFDEPEGDLPTKTFCDAISFEGQSDSTPFAPQKNASTWI